jgi:DNA-binding FrmR family transcriptional regulator
MPSADCAKIIKHLNRIQGQINALKTYVEEERSCEDVSHLARSILTSFASVRAHIIEETLARELGKGKLKTADIDRLHSVLALYKS